MAREKLLRLGKWNRRDLQAFATILDTCYALFD
jgi:hypothetical protein